MASVHGRCRRALGWSLARQQLLPPEHGEQGSVVTPDSGAPCNLGVLGMRHNDRCLLLSTARRAHPQQHATQPEAALGHRHEPSRDVVKPLRGSLRVHVTDRLRARRGARSIAMQSARSASTGSPTPGRACLPARGAAPPDARTKLLRHDPVERRGQPLGRWRVENSTIVEARCGVSSRGACRDKSA